MKENHLNDLSHHILPNSATMVGVCIMVISIFKSVGPGLEIYLIDKVLAIDSVMFMLSALLSFLSIRTEQSSERIEGFAEVIFLLGLVSMTLITVIFTFEII
jgi:multisubunit Na+/H+ antiporter MnhF subunit